MKPNRLVLLALMGLPLLASADSYPKRKLEFKPAEYNLTLRDYNFPSGLRVVFQEDHSQPLVSITMVNGRGSTADPAGREGIAHLVEHLWFRSYQSVDGDKAPKVWDMLELMGANLNAFTADDETVYMTVAPAKHLPTLMKLERQRMVAAIAGVKPDVLDVEKDVVRNELRMRYENSSGAAFGHLMVRLFPKSHPYGRAAYAGIGNHESLNAITLDDVASFVKENYGPDKTTIFVTGDFKLEDSWKLIEQGLGYEVLVDPANPTAELKPMEPKGHLPVINEEPPPPAQPAEIKGEPDGIQVVRGPVEEPFAMIGWSLPPGWRENQPLMQVAVSRMASGIAEETEYDFSKVGCGLSSQVYASMGYCIVEMKKGTDGKAVAAKALDGLYHAWSNPESETDRGLDDLFFNYSKQQGLASVFQSVDLISSLFTDRVTSAAMYTYYTGDLKYFSAQFSAISKVDIKQVREFAQKYLHRGRAAALVMEPYEEGDITVDSSNSTYKGANRADRASSPITEKMVTEAVLKDAAIPPQTEKVVEEKLPNGMRVVVMPYSNSPLVQAGLYFKGGDLSAFPRGLANFADVMQTNDSWAGWNFVGDEASAQLTAQGIDTLRIAGFDSYGVGGSATTFNLSASVGNTTDAIYILRERIENLRADTNGKLDWAREWKKLIATILKDPFWWAQTQQMGRLAPGHALSDWYTHSDYDAFMKWGLADVSSVYANILRPENGVILVVGNVDPKAVIADAKTWFGGWSGWGEKPATPAELKTTYAPLPAPPNRTVILFNKDKASQADVTYMCQLPNLDEQGQVTATILADTLDTKAWMALREETGASYGASAGAMHYPGGVSALIMNSLVENGKVAMGVQAFLNIGQGARDGKIDPDDVAVAKYKRAQQLVLGHQSTEQMYGRLMGLFTNLRPLDFYNSYYQRLANANIPAMIKLMETCVGHEVVTVVGPVEVLKPTFDAAKISYEVFDWQQARLDYAAKHGIKIKPEKEDKKKKAE